MKQNSREQKQKEHLAHLETVKRVTAIVKKVTGLPHDAATRIARKAVVR